MDELSQQDTVRAAVAASWERCRKNGMDSNQKPAPVRLTGKELESGLKSS
jgi:transcriptional regulator of acetoin/glycerol metabolism